MQEEDFHIVEVFDYRYNPTLHINLVKYFVFYYKNEKLNALYHYI